MIFKAIVVSRTKDDNKIYITIPVLDGSNSKENFKGVNKRLATVCSLPGCTPIYATGDIVYVDFEEDNMAYPVVIGSLLSSESKSSIINLDAESLTVNVNTQLSEDTAIGNTMYDQIAFAGSSEGGSADLGTVPVVNGGTGLTQITTGNYLIGNDKEPLTEKTPEEVRLDIGAINKDVIDTQLNRTTAVTAADTNYNQFVARGSKLLDATTYDNIGSAGNPTWQDILVPGAIVWKCETT